MSIITLGMILIYPVQISSSAVVILVELVLDFSLFCLSEFSAVMLVATRTIPSDARRPNGG